MKKLFFYFFILHFFVSCNETSNLLYKEEHLLTFPHVSVNKPLDLFETLFIKLETTDESLIGDIQQIESFEDQIIILTDKQLLAFSDSGKFLSKIGTIGAAAGEYIMPISFTIRPDQKSIEVIDIQKNVLYSYSLINYEFIHSVELPVKSSAIEFFKNGNKIIYNKEYGFNIKHSKNYFTLLGQDLKPYKSYIPKVINSGYTTGVSKTIYSLNDNLFGYTPFIPIVFQFKEDTFFPFYRFEIENFEFPPIDFLKK